MVKVQVNDLLRPWIKDSKIMSILKSFKSCSDKLKDLSYVEIDKGEGSDKRDGADTGTHNAVVILISKGILCHFEEREIY